MSSKDEQSKAPNQDIALDTRKKRYDINQDDSYTADDLSGQLVSSSPLDDYDDEDDDYEYLDQDQEFEYEQAPKVTFDDLVTFCDGNVKMAKQAYRQGMKAVEAGASVPIDVRPAVVLNKSPEVGASVKKNTEIER